MWSIWRSWSWPQFQQVGPWRENSFALVSWGMVCRLWCVVSLWMSQIMGWVIVRIIDRKARSVRMMARNTL